MAFETMVIRPSAFSALEAVIPEQRDLVVAQALGPLDDVGQDLREDRDHVDRYEVELADRHRENRR
jgi:hypothetical protein